MVKGAGRSSEVERSLMVRCVVGSILHGVDPLSYFSFQPLLHDWCNKGCGMCYPVCGMVHIKEPLLLIDKSSLCGGSGFPFSLSEWSLTTMSEHSTSEQRPAPQHTRNPNIVQLGYTIIPR